MSLRRVLILSSIITLAAQASWANPDNKFAFRVGYAQSEPDASSVASFFGVVPFLVQADSASGGELAFEWYATSLIGLEFSVSRFDHDVNFETPPFALPFAPAQPSRPIQPDSISAELGSVKITPLLLNLNFHVVRSDKVDFYLGPTFGYIQYGDFELRRREFELDPETAILIIDAANIALDNDYALGFNIGLDVDFSSRWGAYLGLRYLETASELGSVEGQSDLSIQQVQIDQIRISPLIFRVGLGLKF